MKTYSATLAMVMGALALGGCQLVSGLSGLHEGSGGNGGGATTTSTTTSDSTTGSTTGSTSTTTSTTTTTVMPCTTEPFCQPKTLVTVTNGPPRSVVSDGQHVYWAVGSGIDHLQLPQGGVMTFASSIDPRRLAIDATNVYWSNGSEVRLAPKGVPNAGDPVHALGGVGAGLRAAKTILVWAEVPEAPVLPRLVFSPKVANAMTYNLAVQLPTGSPFATDDDYAYWYDSADKKFKKIEVAASSSAQVVEVTTSVENVVAMAADAAADGWVYWITASMGGRGTLKRVPKSGSKAEVIVPTGDTRGLLVDGGYVYWTDSADCDAPSGVSLMAAPTSGLHLSQPIATIKACSEITADAAALYWIEGDDIVRMLKPPSPM